MKIRPGWLVLALPLAMGACDSSCSFTDPDDPTKLVPPLAGEGGAGGAGGGAGGGIAGAGGGEAGAGGGEAGAGGGGASLATIVDFDAMVGELPEGLVLDGTTAYVGFAPTGEVVKVDVTNGTVTDFAQSPAIPANGGFFLGMVLSPAKDLYAGLASFGAGVVPGVYKVGMAGGPMTLYAADPAMTFPNGLALDAANVLFVADSSGRIFKVTDVAGVGTAAVWKEDPLLAPEMAAPCPGIPFPIGANGIVLTDDAAYVANTTKGTIVQIAIAGGVAGAATVLAGPDCDKLGGADGLALLPDGSLLVTANSIDAIAHVSTTGTITTAVSGPPLGSPASLVVDGDTAYITNAAFAGAPEQPALLSYGPLP